jgi:uncharacterized membrane protein YcaP (DUF421 family)
MEATIINTIVRTSTVYVLAILLARLMGRKLISQMTFFDFVVGVSMGSLSANAMIGSSRSLLSSVTSLVVISLLAIGTSYLHIKSFKARKLIDSEPVTLVENGVIVEENIKRIRMTINELTMKLREKNAFNLADVEFAIMEMDGQLSVLPKADKKPLTPFHINLQTTSTGLTKDIIIDGNLMKENLKGTGLNEQWLNSQLKRQKVNSISEVFYAGIDNNKNLYISKKNASNKEGHGKYGIE